MKEGICQFGDCCPFAHSEEELEEWRERFEAKKTELQKSQEGSQRRNSYSEGLLEKLINAENPEDIVSLLAIGFSSDTHFVLEKTIVTIVFFSIRSVLA